MVWEDHTAVFFSGGGLKVAAFLGCLETVDLGHVEVFYGLSAGSLLACLLAAGMSVAAVQAKFLGVSWANFFFETCDFERLLAGKPPMDAQKLRATLHAWLAECGVPRGATLAWLAARRRAAFGCFAAELETGRVVLFEAAAWPDVGLVDALMASMAIPGAVEAVRVAGRRYVDLGITNNTPLSFLAPQLGGRKLLAFSTNRQLPFAAEKLRSPAAALWLKTSFLMNAELEAADPRRVTVVEALPPPSEVHFFRVSAADMDALFRQGRMLFAARMLRSELAGLLALFCHGRLVDAAAGRRRPPGRALAGAPAAGLLAWGRGAARSLLDLFGHVVGKEAA